MTEDLSESRDDLHLLRDIDGKLASVVQRLTARQDPPDIVRVFRLMIGAAMVIAMIVLYADADSFLGSIQWRDPSAVQVVQIWVDHFIAPAIGVIGGGIGLYILTRFAR